ncbi:MAG: ATP-binding protein, partial [Rhodospirillaceae bacterium]
QHPAKVKGIAIGLENLDQVFCPVRGDSLRLRQVLVNLVGNAVKFTETGQITLRIEAFHIDGVSTRSGSAIPAGLPVRLRLSVVDTGIGIPEEAQGRLFSPFAQADNSTSRRFGGSGLGLAICNRLVKMMGGEVTVESAPGQGSTFSFEIGLMSASVLDVSYSMRTDPVPERPGTGRRAAYALTILVAEDNDINRMLIQSMLSNKGHDVVVVEDGAQAWDHLCRPGITLPDVLIVDMRMPTLDGPTLVKRIRAADPPLNTLPMIGLTADAMADELERYMASGLDSILTKPVNWAKLDDLLIGVLPQTRIATAAARSLIDLPTEPSTESTPLEAAPSPDQDPTDAFPILDSAVLNELAKRLGALEPDGAPSAKMALRSMVDAAIESIHRLGAGLVDQSADLDHSLAGLTDVRDMAHSLKGVSAQFGLRRLSDAARHLQEQLDSCITHFTEVGSAQPLDLVD